jgi:hypothetical protein
MTGLRDIARDRGVGIEKTLLDQHTGKHGRYRLADGEHDMASLRRLIKVALNDARTILENHQTIGMREPKHSLG